MSAPTVKTFNDDEIRSLIRNSDPILQLYIRRLKEALQRQQQLTGQAINKLRDMKKKHMDELREKWEQDEKCPICGSID